MNLTLYGTLKELTEVLGNFDSQSAHPAIRNLIQVQWLSGAVTADFVGQNTPVSEAATPIRIAVREPSQQCSEPLRVRVFLSGITLGFSSEQAVRRLMRNAAVKTADVAATAKTIEEGSAKLSVGDGWRIGWESRDQRGNWIYRIEMEDARYSVRPVN